MPDVNRDFYSASVCEYDSESYDYKPAAAFEAMTGAIAVAGSYRFPDDMTATEFERSLDYTRLAFACYESMLDGDMRLRSKGVIEPDLLRFFQDKWQELVDLNPKLSAIQIDKTQPISLADAISGVACLLNPADIQFYINLCEELGVYNPLALAHEIPGYTTLYEQACKFLPVMEESCLGWVASPETLCDIIAQLSPKPPSPEGP